MADGRVQAAVSDFGGGLRSLLSEGAALADDEAPDTLVASQELEDAAAAHLASGDRDVRELAAQQLAAGAALDFAAGSDLLRAEGEIEQDVALSEGELDFDLIRSEFGAILEAETALGIRQLYPASGESAALADIDLADAVREAIGSITTDSVSIAGNAVSGAGSIGVDAIVGGLGQAADQWLSPIIDELRGRVRWAIRHVAKGVSKLLRLLGPLEPHARKWLREKLAGITQDRIVEFLMEALLEVKKLEVDALARAQQTIEQEPDTVGKRAGELEGLAKRFARYESIIDKIAWLLEKIQPFLLGLAAWVAVALAGVYALILLVAVWVAGDYLDWYRTEMGGTLDVVHGVRSLASVQAPAP